MVQFTFIEKKLRFQYYKEIGINQDAEIIGVDDTTLSKIEKDECIPYIQPVKSKFIHLESFKMNCVPKWLVNSKAIR